MFTIDCACVCVCVWCGARAGGDFATQQVDHRSSFFFRLYFVHIACFSRRWWGPRRLKRGLGPHRRSLRLLREVGQVVLREHGGVVLRVVVAVVPVGCARRVRE
jgi:hypothetical protein